MTKYVRIQLCTHLITTAWEHNVLNSKTLTELHTKTKLLFYVYTTDVCLFMHIKAYPVLTRLWAMQFLPNVIWTMKENG